MHRFSRHETLMLLFTFLLAARRIVRDRIGAFCIFRDGNSPLPCPIRNRSWRPRCWLIMSSVGRSAISRYRSLRVLTKSRERGGDVGAGYGCGDDRSERCLSGRTGDSARCQFRTGHESEGRGVCRIARDMAFLLLYLRSIRRGNALRCNRGVLRDVRCSSDHGCFVRTNLPSGHIREVDSHHTSCCNMPPSALHS